MKLKTVGRNSAFLFAGTVVNMVTTLIFVPILARYLGVANYGIYTYVYAFVGMFESFATFGTYTIFTREVARQKEKAEQHLGNVIILKVVLTVATLGAIVLASHILAKPDEWLFILICSGEVLIRRFFALGSALFRAHQRMEFEFYTSSVDRIVAFVAVLLAVRLDLGLTGVFVAFLLGSVASATLAAVIALRRFVRLRFERVPGIFRWYLKSSWALGLASEANSLYNRIGTVLLGQLTSSAEVGTYSGAYRMYYFGASRAAESISAAAFPALAKESHHPRRFNKSFWRMFGILTTGSVVVAVGVWAVSPWVIHTLLGPSFVDSGQVLRWMCVAVPFTFVGGLYGVGMKAADRQNLDSMLTIATLAVMLALNWMLIPRYGALGAAWAFICGEVLSVLLRAVVFRGLPVPRPAVELGPVAADGSTEV